MVSDGFGLPLMTTRRTGEPLTPPASERRPGQALTGDSAIPYPLSRETPEGVIPLTDGGPGAGQAGTSLLFPLFPRVP
jgi:hypothetical protein